ncbi:YggU family protein [Candidatus Micrarchaeota archaeon]|nr:YggU family protein [Candidatus Micrarchaeota archaeon]
MLKETAKGTVLEAEIQPNAERFEIGTYDPWTKRLKIRVTENPIKGKANRELIDELSKLLNASVVLVKGEKSTKKTLLIKQDRKIVEKRLDL